MHSEKGSCPICNKPFTIGDMEADHILPWSGGGIGIECSPTPDPLTPKQRRLIDELHEISSIVRVDYWNIRDREREARTPVLEVMKRELILGEVVGQYTLIDDLLSTELCRYFLPGENLQCSNAPASICNSLILRATLQCEDGTLPLS